MTARPNAAFLPAPARPDRGGRMADVSYDTTMTAAELHAEIIGELRGKAARQATYATAWQTIAPAVAACYAERARLWTVLADAVPTVFHADATGQMVWAAENNVPTADEAFEAGYSAAQDDNKLADALAAAALPAVLGDAYSDRLAVMTTNPAEAPDRDPADTAEVVV